MGFIEGVDRRQEALLPPCIEDYIAPEALAKTRHHLALVERRLCDGAEAETIRRRPKSRWYHRRMSRWTGADEAEYRRILDRMTDAAQAELERLRRKVERQNGF